MLGLRDHLVVARRLERHEPALLGHRVRRRHVRHRDHVDRDAAGVGLLLEAADHVLPAGAQQLDLDAVFLLEGLCDVLCRRDRRRGVPGERALASRCGFVDRIGLEILCVRRSAEKCGRDQRRPSDDPHDILPRLFAIGEEVIGVGQQN